MYRGAHRIAFVSLLSGVLFLVALAPEVLAQRSTATLLGTARDATGAVLPGATVSLVNEATNVRRTLVTDVSGSFAFPSLDPGQYQLIAELDGFQSASVRNISLAVDTQRRVDLTLDVAQVAERVEVSASAVHVQTDTANVSAVIPGEEIQRLPNVTRHYLEALSYRAGISPSFGSSSDWVSGWASPATQGNWAADSNVTNYNVGGGRVSQNTFTIDGVANTNSAYGTSAVSPSIEAIQEVRVDTSYYSAESKGSSVVNVSIKSGGNKLRGSLFESFRGAVLQPTDPRTSHPQTREPYKPEYKYHQFGGTLGGPVLRDRTFFFVSYEGLVFRNTRISEVNLFDPAWLTGDFSSYRDANGNLIPIYDPATSPRTPFPNNQIPAGRIAPQSAKYLELFVPRNITGGVQILDLTNRYNVGNLMTRVDHNFSDRDKVYGRLGVQSTSNREAAFTKESDGVLDVPGKNVAVTYTRIFSPRLVNEFRLGYSHSAMAMSLDTAGGARDFAREVGFANTNPDPGTFGVPRIFFSGGLPNLGPSLSIEENTVNSYQLYNVLSWARGRQNWKIGVDIRRDLNEVVKSTSWGRGGLRFWNGYTAASPTAAILPGHRFADFLLGQASYARMDSVPQHWNPRVWGTGVFVQNDWAVAPNLTLNLGLRYEYSAWPQDLAPGGLELDLNVPGGGLLSPSRAFVDTVNTPLIAYGSRPGVMTPDRNDFAPRVGLAWRPFKTDETVLRAGYGIFYVKADDWYTWERGRPPALLRDPVPISRSRTQPGIDVRELWPPATTTGTATPFWARDVLVPDSRHPYSQQFSAGIQQVLAGNLLLDLRYQGRLGTNLPIYVLFNQADANPDRTSSPQSRAPYANFTTDSSIICYCAESTYHALQVDLQRRMYNGLGFTVAYTWSQSRDMGSEIQSSGATSNIPQNSHDLDGEWAVSSFDVPHRFVATAMYQLPFGRGRRWLSQAPGLVEAVLGGWEATSIVTFMSGRPFTPIAGSDNSNSGLGAYASAQRLNQVGDPYPPGFERSLTAWFDPAAFEIPPFGTFGNAGRNSLRGVDTRRLDLAVLKTFRLRGGANLEFRGTLYNLTGRFGNGAIPIRDIRYGSDFGKVVLRPENIWAAADKQVSLKLTF